MSSGVNWNGRRARGLNPLTGQDARLAGHLLRGEFAVHGFRNNDLRRLLFPEAKAVADRRRQSGKATRSLRLFRAHGLIQKNQGSHRYQLTMQGRRILPAFIAARHASIQELNKLAV